MLFRQFVGAFSLDSTQSREKRNVSIFLPAGPNDKTNDNEIDDVNRNKKEEECCCCCAYESRLIHAYST